MAEALTFKVGADTAAFQKGMKQAMVGLAGLGAAFVSVRAIVDAFSASLEMGGKMNDLSKQTGETAGNMAVLARAFQNAGAGAEAAGPAISKMQKWILDASVAGGAAEQSLNGLGLTFQDLEGKMPMEQMKILAGRISQISDPTLKANAVMDIFGARNAKLIALLSDFGSEVETAKGQLGSLPEILDDTAQGFDDVGDNLTTLREKTTEVASGFLSELLPAANKVIDALTGLDAAGFGKKLGGALVNSTESQIDAIDFQIDVAKKLRDKADNLFSDGSGRGTAAGSGYQDKIDMLLQKRAALEEKLNRELQEKINSQRDDVFDPERRSAWDEPLPPVVKPDKTATGKAHAIRDHAKEIRDFIDENLAKDAMSAMDKIFGPVAEAGAKLRLHMDEARLSAYRIADRFDDTEAKVRPANFRASAGRQDRKDKIKGAAFASGAYGYNDDGSTRTKEQYERGEKSKYNHQRKDGQNLRRRQFGDLQESIEGKSPTEEAVRSKAGASSDRTGTLEAIATRIETAVKEMNTKLPQHVLA